MTILDLQRMFNRALDHTFSRSKLLLTSAILAMCGLLTVFFRGLAFHASEWVVMSLTFLPIFLCAGVLLSLGIILTRTYHHEIKYKESSLKHIFERSWEIVIGASYFCVPIILCYLLMWVTFGVFLVLKEIPALGEPIGVVLSFGPFLLNLGSVLLCILNIAILFFVTPAVALKSFDPISVSQIIARRLGGDIFSNMLLVLVAALPLAFVFGILSLAAVLTGSTYIEADTSLHVAMHWFFIMIPYTALASPAVVFFFNFAAEGHVHMRRALQQEQVL
ncbi:Uncharacterized protein SCG7086_AF_00050 [Chlamydiales bacterium SCGC AG-110-P3]|nr:Uncharacterized protein SCG7086_AF_00050 [Chlamydiales bacterium SCGC AG-110-P3]